MYITRHGAHEILSRVAGKVGQWFSPTDLAIMSSMGDDPDRSLFFVEWMRAGVGLSRDPNRLPTLAEVSAAAKRAWARAAFRSADGNVSRAAEMVGATRPTFYRALTDATVTDDLWHDAAMHDPFDDQLFPFVRCLWPADPTAAWAEEYCQWLLEAIVPRAIAEGVKVVNLENWSQMVGTPPASALARIKYLTEQTTSHAAEAGGGAVFYAPHIPIAGFLAPIINLVPVPLRIATTTDKVEKHATALFHRAGGSVPSNLTLD